jgi:hypothetical protein
VKRTLDGLAFVQSLPLLPRTPECVAPLIHRIWPALIPGIWGPTAACILAWAPRKAVIFPLANRPRVQHRLNLTPPA